MDFSIKMPNLILDAKNRQLLKTLEHDSRIPLAKIAKSLGMSKEVVHYRFQKLIQKGLITNFKSIIDFFLLDYQYYRLLININNWQREIREKMIHDLKQNPFLDLYLYLSSNWDFELNIWVKSSQEFYDFYNAFIEKYTGYIADKELYLITKQYTLAHSYLYPREENIILGGGTTHYTLDEKDTQLLFFLQQHPRIELLKLAHHINLTPSATHSRLVQLQKKNILKSTVPLLNTSLLGYNTYRVSLSLENPSQKKQFTDFLSHQPFVTKICELIGRRDLDFEVEFQTAQELDSFLEAIRTKLPPLKDFNVFNIIYYKDQSI